MLKRWLLKLGSEFSMLGVLLLLCVYYSLVTIDHRQATGALGGAECARQLLREPKQLANVVIVVGTSSDNAGFAEEAQRKLQAGGARNIHIISGNPHEVRTGLQQLMDSHHLPTAIACTADESASLDTLKQKLPGISTLPTVIPTTHAWPVFLTSANLLNVTNQIVVIAIIAVGMTMVIITGGIDLSAGSLVALSAVTAGMLISRYAGGMHATPMGMTLCCLAGILICGLVGAFTGGMITLFKIPPFIITLAMMQVASGRAFKITKGGSIYDVPDAFTWLGRGDSIAGIPNAVLLMVVVYIVAHITMSRTKLGRYIYAVGGNAEAARLSGVNVSLIIMTVYILSGLLAGLGGVIVASQLKGSSPTYGIGYELSVIAAVVVGGTSLTGGEGSVLKTLVGALIIGVIQNGMNLTGIEPYSQKEVLGWVILGAVLLDSLKRTHWQLPAWLMPPPAPANQQRVHQTGSCRSQHQDRNLKRGNTMTHMSIRLTTWIALILTICLSTISCDNKNSDATKTAGTQQPAAPTAPPTVPPDSSKPKPLICVSLLTLTNPFFKDMADTMQAEGQKHGYEVVVTSGEFDPARQKDQVKDFLVRKASAIILTPCDSKSIGTAIIEANNAGVPVFTADVKATADGIKVVGHCGTDNLEGGRVAGKAIVEALAGKGKVAMIDQPEVETGLMRETGCLEELANAPGIEVVAKLPSGGARDKGFAAAQDLIQSHPDVTAIFCVNDPTALGVMAALEKAGKLNQIKVVGFDGQLEARQAVKDGKLYATVMQYPRKIASVTIDNIAKYLAGDDVPAKTLLPPSLYRQSDTATDAELK